MGITCFKLQKCVVNPNVQLVRPSGTPPSEQ